MKKLIVTTLISRTILTIPAQPACAAIIEEQSSSVGIQFDTEGPVQPGAGPFKDNLAMVYTPSKFDFGKQKVTANIATYSNTVQGNQYVVVNDDRQSKSEEEGVVTTSAWKITASMSKLVSKDDSATELPAKLTFSLEDPQSYDIGEVDSEINDFVPNPIDGNLGTIIDPSNIVVGKNITLDAGNTTGVEIIAKTREDAIKGGFATKLKDTKLVVNSGEAAAGKSFKGSVTWSLNNTY